MLTDAKATQNPLEREASCAPCARSCKHRASWAPDGFASQRTPRIDDRACVPHPGCTGTQRRPKGSCAELSWAPGAGFLGTQASRALDGRRPRKMHEDSWAQRLRGLHTLVDRTLDACGRKGAPRNRRRGGFLGPRSKHLRTLKRRGLLTRLDSQRAPRIRGR